MLSSLRSSVTGYIVFAGIMFMMFNFSLVATSSEDGDALNQAKIVKPTVNPNTVQIRQTETVFGIPLPLDEIFDQITSLPSDDPVHDSNECTGGSDLSELDMCLTQSQFSQMETLVPVTPGRKKRQAAPNGFSLWKNGIIPYLYNASFATIDRDAIISAMTEWERATCVRFRPANVDDRDVVVFRDGKRCSTNIGRIGHEQAVTLAKSCRSKRILIHELGHVIGLIHEHQRFDRDKYVEILMENVRNMSQERYQFSKLLSGSITEKTVKYDYTSVMHYGRNYFARSPELTTLHTKDRNFQDVIGRAEKPSYSDLETVNRLYQCAVRCPGSLRCGHSCFMDSACVCRCRAGSDKASFQRPRPYGNSLPDQTCEFFASRGECLGNIKDTIRPLCVKSCSLYRPKGRNTTEPGSGWSHYNRPHAKPFGPQFLGAHINAESIKDVSLYQGGKPQVSFGQTRSNRIRPSAFRLEQQFLPSTDTIPQNRMLSSARNQLEPSPSAMGFRPGRLQRPPSISLSDPSSRFRPLVMTRSSNGRTARLFIPTQMRGRGRQGRMSHRQRVNYRAMKASRFPGYVSNNSELEILLKNPQTREVNGNTLKSRLRHPYQRRFSRPSVQQSTNYDSSGPSSFTSITGENWRYGGRDRSVNLLKALSADTTSNSHQSTGDYPSMDAWSKGRRVGYIGQTRPIDLGVLGSLTHGGPEVSQTDPSSVSVNIEPLPDAQQGKYGSQGLQTTGPSFIKSGHMYSENTHKDLSSRRRMPAINQLETSKAEWEFQHQLLMPTADQQMTAQGISVDMSAVLNSSGNRQPLTMARRPYQYQPMKSLKQRQFFNEASLTDSVSRDVLPVQRQQLYNRESGVEKSTYNSRSRDQTASSDHQAGQVPTMFNQLLDSLNPLSSNQRHRNSSSRFNRLNRMPALSDHATAGLHAHIANKQSSNQRTGNSPAVLNPFNQMPSLSDPVASSLLDSDNIPNENVASSLGNVNISNRKVASSLVTLSSRASRQHVLTQTQSPETLYANVPPLDRNNNPKHNSYQTQSKLNRNSSLTSEFFRHVARRVPSIFSPIFLGTSGQYLASSSRNIEYVSPRYLARSPLQNRANVASPLHSELRQTRLHHQNMEHMQHTTGQDQNILTLSAGRIEASRGNASHRGTRVGPRDTSHKDHVGPEEAIKAGNNNNFTQKLPDEAGMGHRFYK